MGKNKSKVYSVADVKEIYAKAILKARKMVAEGDFDLYCERVEAEDLVAAVETAVVAVLTGVSETGDADDAPSEEDRILRVVQSLPNIDQVLDSLNKAFSGVRVSVDGVNTLSESADEEKEYDPKGFPLNTPLDEMTGPEREAWWRFQARKHESRAKANLKEIDKLRRKLGARSPRANASVYNIHENVSAEETRQAFGAELWGAPRSTQSPYGVQHPYGGGFVRLNIQ